MYIAHRLYERTVGADEALSRPRDVVRDGGLRRGTLPHPHTSDVLLGRDDLHTCASCDWERRQQKVHIGSRRARHVHTPVATDGDFPEAGQTILVLYVPEWTRRATTVRAARPTGGLLLLCLLLWLDGWLRRCCYFLVISLALLRRFFFSWLVVSGADKPSISMESDLLVRLLSCRWKGRSPPSVLNAKRACWYDVDLLYSCGYDGFLCCVGKVTCA